MILHSLQTAFVVSVACLFSQGIAASDLTLQLAGKTGPGKGKHVVLVSGDEEYRSEEALPMLAKILSQRHGFDCTVLFSIDPATGTINPNIQTTVPGLEALAQADLMIIATRFRKLTEAQLAPIAAYLRAGKPVFGLRTATHAFTGDAATGDFKWAEFGLLVLGEKWVDHHGKHKEQGTRGVIEAANARHPVLNGVKDVFGTSDVYTVANLGADATILLRGAVTESLEPNSRAVEGKLNVPMMPLAWLREYAVMGGKTGRAFCSTMGASVDFENADLRRLVVNATYHLTGLAVPASANVTPVDPYRGTFYGSIRKKDAWKNRALKPADLGLGKATAPFEVPAAAAGTK
jgi:hypothetical protein